MLENFGRYKIRSPLGKGAMGVVYLADDPVLGRQVALKTIDLAVEDPARREFLRGLLMRDARAAAALTHPNIVSVFDVVEQGETAAIIMEYVDGENLAAYLARNPVAEARFTLQIVRAMASALDYTHSRGIVHRDIKPANVMLDGTRTPKITDFGIARITEGVTTTMTGAVMGTIEYMAPEQVKGETVDGRADQFALGVVTYRMLTGHTLFDDQSMATVAYKIVNEAPAPISSRNSGLPRAMDSVLAKALAKDPKDRYGGCGEFAEALAAAFAGVDREAPTVAMGPLAAKTGTKLPVLALSGFAVLAAGAGVAVWRPWASAPPSHAPAPSAANATPGSPMQQGPPGQKGAAAAGAAQTPAAQTPAATAEAAPVRGAEGPVSKPLGTAVEKPATPGGTESDGKKSTPGEPEPVKLAEPPAPVSVAAALSRGRDLMKKQDYSGAVQAFSKAVELHPNWGQAYHSRGNAYQALEQYDAAIHDYTQAIRLNPAIMNFYLSRAACYVNLQQDDQALADLTHALAIKADAPAALSARAAVYLRRKEFQKALEDLSAVLLLQPGNVQAYRQRAAARRGLGDIPGARSDVRKANELAAKKRGG